MNGKVNADKINLVNVKILKSNIEAGSSFVKDAPCERSLLFAHDSGVNIDDKNILINLNIKIDFKGTTEEQSAKGEFRIQYLFNVENLDELMQISDSEAPNISGELAATLMGIAYSTSRGIILTSTENSVLGGILLPVVSPVKILENKQKDKN